MLFWDLRNNLIPFCKKNETKFSINYLESKNSTYFSFLVVKSSANIVALASVASSLGGCVVQTPTSLDDQFLITSNPLRNWFGG